MSTDPVILKAISSCIFAEGDRDPLSYFEIVTVKRGSRVKLCYLCLGRHAFYLLRMNMKGLISNGTIEYDSIDKAVVDPANNSAMLLILTGMTEWEDNQVSLASDDRHNLLLRLIVAWQTHHMWKSNTLKYLPVVEYSLASSQQAPSRIRVHPFKGFARKEVGGYSIFLRESFQRAMIFAALRVGSDHHSDRHCGGPPLNSENKQTLMAVFNDVRELFRAAGVLTRVLTLVCGTNRATMQAACSVFDEGIHMRQIIARRPRARDESNVSALGAAVRRLLLGDQYGSIASWKAEGLRVRIEEPIPIDWAKEEIALKFLAVEERLRMIDQSETWFNVIQDKPYMKRMNLNDDLSAWSGWEFLSKTMTKASACVLLRRKYTPPLMDNRQDIIVTVHCPMKIMGKGRFTDDELLTECHIIADSITSMNEKSTVYCDMLQAKVDALMFNSEAYKWLNSRLDVRPSFAVHAKRIVAAVISLLQREGLLQDRKVVSATLTGIISADKSMKKPLAEAGLMKLAVDLLDIKDDGLLLAALRLLECVVDEPDMRKMLLSPRSVLRPTVEIIKSNCDTKSKSTVVAHACHLLAGLCTDDATRAECIATFPFLKDCVIRAFRNAASRSAEQTMCLHAVDRLCRGLDQEGVLSVRDAVTGTLIRDLGELFTRLIPGADKQCEGLTNDLEDYLTSSLQVFDMLAGEGMEANCAHLKEKGLPHVLSAMRSKLPEGLSDLHARIAALDERIRAGASERSAASSRLMANG
ncbi:hypothetical protein FOZ60_003548 [Perkinsus olseni]|uniref:Uncharacterized protein n=1 Tax=Perkinsus olseni TaxID=32597 RepID=A0A7J6NVD4_PEROL|nr:hypothetical protein FOZ60_003548 [Perkinsus olseni]